MHDIVELVRAVAWPITTLTIALLMRSEARSLAAAIAERIRTASSIVIGRRGLEIKGVRRPVALTMQQRKLNFRRVINRIKTQAELNAICDQLRIESVPAAESRQRAIIDFVTDVAKNHEEMDRMSDLLKPITGEDF